MNERIKELLSEAKIYDGSTTQNITTCPSDLEKFAELIVRECAEIDWRSRLPILQHFGVEE
jgi:hypothetical protein